MLSQALENTLSVIFMRARERQHEFITIEHLLLGLIDDPETGAVLNACGANVTRLKATLDIFIDETTPRSQAQYQRDIQPTLSFQRVLQRAIDQVRATGRPEVNGPSALIALYGEPESQAVYFLHQECVTFSDVMNYVTQDIFNHQQPKNQSNNTNSIDFSFDEKTQEEHSFEDPFQADMEKTLSPEQAKEQELIAQYAEDLNEKAKLGKIDPLIGRDKELDRAIQVLCRRRKNNPLFVGEAGVGKTAIAEGLAQMVVEKKVPKALQGAKIYALDLAILLAGTKYRGDFEKRFKAVLKALSAQNDAIVFIDEIHNLVGAGSATGSTMDASNLIKPLLSSGEIRCMGATTYEEYRTYIEKDSALLRRFQKIDIEEPSNEEALEILHGLQGRFERYHSVKYTEEALRRAIELSSRYMNDRQLPDKAIDVIDEAGAFARMQPEATRQDTINVEDIERVIAKITRVPIEKLDASNKSLLQNLPERIKAQVYGQDHAVDLLCDAIKLTHAGLRGEDKPTGSFLLAGPTGVGKTEVVKQLSLELGVELVRFDMSEYMERHTVSRLVGAPPGYVGYEQAGLLTEKIIKHPHCVLLLDEIEKAHPDVFNILLQVMDYGTLTDNNGRKADFRHVIIVMTSNVGADLMDKRSVGFGAQDDKNSDRMEAVKTVFTPEFRNRLDAVIPFNALDEKIIVRVVEKNLSDLQKQLQQHNVTLNITDLAKHWLAEKGYDKAMGARPMTRLVQEQIKKPLADQILFGELSGEAGTVTIDVQDDGIDIDYASVSSE